MVKKNMITVKDVNIRTMIANSIEFDAFRDMESLNSEIIKQGMPRDVRYDILHRIAEEQLKVLNEQNAEYRFKKLTSSTDLIE